jgi:hypothetical protein
MVFVAGPPTLPQFTTDFFYVLTHSTLYRTLSPCELNPPQPSAHANSSYYYNYLCLLTQSTTTLPTTTLFQTNSTHFNPLLMLIQHTTTLFPSLLNPLHPFLNAYSSPCMLIHPITTRHPQLFSNSTRHIL